MFRYQRRKLNRITLELGLKPFTRLDDQGIRQTCHKAFDNWRALIEDAQHVDILLWIGDGDEVFNWRGNMEDQVQWNDTVGFNCLKYGAYPPSRHYETWRARPFMENPVTMTYNDIRRIIAALKSTCQEMYGKSLRVGETIDAGPEFLESKFKFERHRELLKGGPQSEVPSSLAFLCCYAEMKVDDYPYATFPGGIPEGTPFGTFLGRQFKSMADALGFDWLWLSNGFGVTHYAWSYLGEVYDGETCRPELAAESIRDFSSFWENFRRESPDRPMEIRGTNFSIGMDATAHGIDIRQIYRIGDLALPSPNPPWGSNNLGLEIVSQMSRISSTPTRAIPLRYYVCDNWMAVVPWWDYYNREPFDIYCPMSVGRLNALGQVETPTDLKLFTINTGFGELSRTQALEIVPHIRRAFDTAPDEAGPLLWVYPFSEYQDELHKPDGRIIKSFFGDWYVARAVASGLPLNTVITTDNFAKLMIDKPDFFRGRTLVFPAPAKDWPYASRLIQFIKSGGQAIIYGSLADAPRELLDLLNIRLAEPVDGDLPVKISMAGDSFTSKPRGRKLRHLPHNSDGGICEIIARSDDPTTTVKATVGSGKSRRTYALVRQPKGAKGGRVAWIRGSLPFETKGSSLEPVAFDSNLFEDASLWMRYLLSDFGIDIRQTRNSPATRAVNLFITRCRGSLFFNGHTPDATVNVSLSLPQGAPLFCERSAFIDNSAAQYCLDRSFHFECQALIDQKERSLVTHKEHRTVVTQTRHFQISGLKDATVTLLVPHEALRDGTLQVRSAIPYVINDPTSGSKIRLKGVKYDKNGWPIEPLLKYKVDPITGGAIVKNVTGTIDVLY
jgi:hypothetical protein